MFFDVSDKLDLIKCKIEWKIFDLKLRKEFGQYDQVLISKNFYNPRFPSVVWELHVYPKYNLNSYRDSTHITLTQLGLKEYDGTLTVKFCIYAKDTDANRIDICSNDKGNFKNKSETRKYEIDLSTSTHPDGSVLLHCEVEFVPYNIKCENNQIGEYSTANTSENLLRNMFINGTLSDFIIKIGDEKINVHRCILAQNSNVFLKMFEQKDMNEAKNGELKVVDSSLECFLAMIEYFYIGQLNNKEIMENHPDELFAIAHKYEVKPLMDKCEIIMAEKIDEKNFIKRCRFAQLYELSKLEKACIKYIAANRSSFLDSNEWNELKSENKDFAIHLVELALKNG